MKILAGIWQTMSPEGKMKLLQLAAERTANRWKKEKATAATVVTP